MKRCSCGRQIRPGNKSGMCQPCAVAANNRKRIGSSNPRWRGNEAETSGLHRRVWNARGKASEHDCFFCIIEQAKEWAQIHDTDGTELYHYVPACHACHKAYDYDQRFTRETRAKISNAMMGNQNSAAKR